MTSPPAPFIYWGQNSRNVFLRIALRDVQGQPDVSLSQDRISFEGHGVGAHGKTNYKFDIKPFRYIAPEKSRLRITGSEVQIDAAKRDETTKEDAWPRLTQANTKHAWIKPDFDRMDVSDDEDVELLERKKLEKAYLDKITSEIESTKAEAIEDLKRNYLFSYSLFQFLAALFIFTKISVALATTGAAEHQMYDNVGIVMVVCQIFSFAEIVHSLIGLVRSGVLSPLMLVGGRAVILLVLVWNEPQLQVGYAPTYLAFFWSMADCIRHIFYMVTTVKLSFYWLVWLRYTMWIPLMPLGALCEYIILWTAIPLFRESGKFCLTLPNTLNFSVSVTSLMYIHLVTLPLGIAYLMRYMYSLRKRKLRAAGASSTTGSTAGRDATVSKDKKTN